MKKDYTYCVAADQNSEAQKIQELESALRAAEAQRDDALRELDDIARFLSHDLRAPLRGIDGYSKALVEDYSSRLDPLALSYLQFICDSGHLAAAVLDRLIQYIRIPRARLNLLTVDMSALAQELLEVLSEQASANGAARQVERQVVPGLTAEADERLVRLLLEILFDNAWKFSAVTIPAHITFGAREDAHKDGSRGETVFFVQDDGAGFNPAYAGQLFQPFQRLHSAHEFEGAGMGLAVAKRIVVRHGGRIWAHGEVARGAVIYFTLS